MENDIEVHDPMDEDDDSIESVEPNDDEGNTSYQGSVEALDEDEERPVRP